MNRYNTTLTLLCVVTLILLCASHPHLLIDILVKGAGVAVGIATFFLHIHWEKQGKVKSITED